MNDSSILIIILLLPLAASMLVFQSNPYHALVLRAILGAVAALLYAVLGAADVALTEALVGTMLAITLYVVAVRSSMVMRLGVIEDNASLNENISEKIIKIIQKILHQYHLRLEIVEYPNTDALKEALVAKEVHAICTSAESVTLENQLTYNIDIRIRRLFEIMESDLAPSVSRLSYVTVSEEKRDKL